MSSLINNCYTDLQVALGIVIGKKALIQDFFHFGVSCSYEEVLRYKDSAAAAAVRDVNLMGISTERNRLIQVVSDNFDADISSQNGKLSTHSLAILLTQREYNPSEHTSDTPSTISRMSKTDW